MSDNLTNAIQKAIAKEWEKSTIPAKTNVEFRGAVEVELDIKVSRGEDVKTTPKVDLPFIPVLAAILSNLKVDLDKVEDYILSAYQTSTKVGSKLKRMEDEVSYTFDGIKESIQNSIGKVSKAGNTIVKGVVRLGEIKEKK
jgi:hypothetical protein